MRETPDSIARTIEQFMRREFRIADSDQGFHRDVHLYDAGYVDSAGVVELLAFLESTFQVELPDEDLFGDDFTTINGISRVTHRLSNGTQPVHIPCDRPAPVGALAPAAGANERA